MQKNHVLVVGSTTIDKILHHSTSCWKLGGVTTYAGISFQRQQIETTILSNVAVHHNHLLDVLSREGLQVSCGASEATTFFVHHLKGDERRQELPCTAAPIRVAQIAPFLNSIDLLHLGPLFPEDLESDQLETLQGCVPCISLDLQGYVRKRKRGMVYPAVSNLLPHALRIARFVKADHVELSYILGQYDIALPKLLRAFNIQEIVVTQGAQGGVVRDIDGNELRYKAHPIAVDGDSTGAGDVFFATYLTQRIFHGESAEDSANAAARQAAHQVEGAYIRAEELRLSPQTLRMGQDDQARDCLREE